VSVSGRSSAVQLDLYQNWYPFNFVEAAYGTNQFDFKLGAAAADSGTFGVIDRHLKSPPVWTQHAAKPTPIVTSNRIRLGKFITEMVDANQAGFGRLSTPSLQTDWSKAVERLLAVTYSRSFGHKATLGSARATRGVRAVACLSFQTMAEQTSGLWGKLGGRPPFDGVEIREDDGDPTGISIIHIKVDDSGTTPKNGA
jgi:hypothetical protein